MTPIGPLIGHPDPSLCMVAVHRAWAQQYRKAGNASYAEVQFRAAQDRLEEARIASRPAAGKYRTYHGGQGPKDWPAATKPAKA